MIAGNDNFVEEIVVRQAVEGRERQIKGLERKAKRLLGNDAEAHSAVIREIDRLKLLNQQRRGPHKDKSRSRRQRYPLW